MYLVIDSLLTKDRNGTMYFKQQMCVPKFIFTDYNYLLQTVIHRHTTRPFHFTNCYNGTKEKTIIFGIPNPQLTPMLYVGVVVQPDFDFFKHIPRM